LDTRHRVVDQLADGALARLRFEVLPTRLGRHPEDSLSPVFVGILGVGALGLLGNEPAVLLLERVGDVLEEDEAEYDMLVLGRVHGATEGVGHLPELGLVADGRGGVVRLLLVVATCSHRYSAIGWCLMFCRLISSEAEHLRPGWEHWVDD